MSDQPEKPGKRWIIVKFFEHAIERTEDEIAELKAGRLWVRDASGPDDKQHPVLVKLGKRLHQPGKHVVDLRSQSRQDKRQTSVISNERIAFHARGWLG